MKSAAWKTAVHAWPATFPRTQMGERGSRASLHTEGEDNMGKRFAMLISVAAAGVMVLGAQTVMALVKR
jgi:hypothetical protein